MNVNIEDQFSDQEKVEQPQQHEGFNEAEGWGSLSATTVGERFSENDGPNEKTIWILFSQEALNDDQDSSDQLVMSFTTPGSLKEGIEGSS
ncbi:hypothetical protein DSO57_1022540 [Entomophthora muscae]|uniref:Uncharacterized protein n=1 Tax=Entomophthora muscae TaxID=34485 RepID=A0ACC2TR40_9FUNG|nr:hypothetical protein DSO57_1022540 [Entomophthora muscae]